MYIKILLAGAGVVIVTMVAVLYVSLQGDVDGGVPKVSVIEAIEVDDQASDLQNFKTAQYPVVEQSLDLQEFIQDQNVPEVVEVRENVVFAPDFSLQSLDQLSSFHLRSFAGKKPVIVDFFAAHCPNCRRNLPKIEVLGEKYADQVEVVLIGIDSRSDTVRFFENNPTELTVVMTENHVLSDYRIRLTNTKALINRDGSLLEIVEFRDILEEDFLRLIES